MTISYQTGKRIILSAEVDCTGYRCRRCGAEAQVKIKDIMKTDREDSYTFVCPNINKDEWSCEDYFTVPMFNLTYHILKTKMGGGGSPAPHPESKRFEQMDRYRDYHGF